MVPVHIHCDTVCMSGIHTDKDAEQENQTAQSLNGAEEPGEPDKEERDPKVI